MKRHFGDRPGLCIVLEAGTHSNWLSWCLEGLGHKVVAVSRKLATLLHRLWATAEVYDPLRNSRRLAAV